MMPRCWPGCAGRAWWTRRGASRTPAGLGLAVLLNRLPQLRPGLITPYAYGVAGYYGLVRLVVLAAVIATAAMVAVRLLRRAGRAPA